MRNLSAAFIGVLAVVVLATQTGSARPLVKLVSPALATNNQQFLECTVVNADAAAHDVTITFYDSTGAVASVYPQTVAAGGSAGVSVPGGVGVNHCMITAPGHAEWYRASIDVLDATAAVQPHVVVALPIS